MDLGTRRVVLCDGIPTWRRERTQLWPLSEDEGLVGVERRTAAIETVSIVKKLRSRWKGPHKAQFESNLQRIGN